jgi:hypothetical protein
VRDFVVSGTDRQESIKPGRGLRRFVEAVTLLNTDSNLINTWQGRDLIGNPGKRKKDGRKKIAGDG